MYILTLKKGWIFAFVLLTPRCVFPQTQALTSGNEFNIYQKAGGAAWLHLKLVMPEKLKVVSFFYLNGRRVK